MNAAGGLIGYGGDQPASSRSRMRWHRESSKGCEYDMSPMLESVMLRAQATSKVHSLYSRSSVKHYYNFRIPVKTDFQILVRLLVQTNQMVMKIFHAVVLASFACACIPVAAQKSLRVESPVDAPEEIDLAVCRVANEEFSDVMYFIGDFEEKGAVYAICEKGNPRCFQDDGSKSRENHLEVHCSVASGDKEAFDFEELATDPSE